MSWPPVIFNDLPIVFNSAKVYVCADYTCMSIQTDNFSHLSEALSNDVEALDTWLKGDNYL